MAQAAQGSYFQLPGSLPGDAEHRGRASECDGLASAQPVTEADDLRLRRGQMIEHLAEFLRPHRVGHDPLRAWLSARQQVFELGVILADRRRQGERGLACLQQQFCLVEGYPGFCGYFVDAGRPAERLPQPVLGRAERMGLVADVNGQPDGGG